MVSQKIMLISQWFYTALLETCTFTLDMLEVFQIILFDPPVWTNHPGPVYKRPQNRLGIDSL